MISLDTLFAILIAKPAFVVGAAFALAWILRRRAAAVRHAVWTSAILAILVLPVLSVTLPPLVLRVIPPSDLTREPVARATLRGAAPRSESTAPNPKPMWVAGEDVSNRIESIVVLVWMAGSLLQGIRMGAARLGARRRALRARICESRDAVRTLERTRRSFGIARRIDLLVSDEVSSPVVVGALRPLILMPATSRHWTRHDLALTLTHEAAHIARQDVWWSLLAGAATVLFWMNPLVRYAAGRMRAESERACDDEVIRAGLEPDRYARLLLRVASSFSAKASPGIAMARRGELEGRLRAILDERLARGGVPRWTGLALAGASLLVALPVAALTLGVRSLPVMHPAAPEPDRLGDAWSSPLSERIPLAPSVYERARRSSALAGPDAELAQWLLAGLDHRPEFEGDLIRERAAWALSQAREGKLIEPLLDALGSRDWRVRSYAAWTLATERDPRAVPLLLPLLEDPVWRMRAMAAYALRESRDPRAESAMIRALRDPAWQVRVEAVEYLTALGGDERRERIRPHLHDRHLAVRQAARRAFLNT